MILDQVIDRRMIKRSVKEKSHVIFIKSEGKSRRGRFYGYELFASWMGRGIIIAWLVWSSLEKVKQVVRLVLIKIPAREGRIMNRCDRCTRRVVV